MVIETNCWLESAAINKSRCIESLVRSNEVKPGTSHKPAGLFENHDGVMLERQCHAARPPSFYHL